jgi:hypothetical protein
MTYKKNHNVSTKVELWESFLHIHLLLKSINLPNQVVKVLAYMCVDGINLNTQYKLILDNVCPNRQSYYNCRYLLKQNKLITFKDTWELSKELSSFDIEDVVDINLRMESAQ